MNTNAITDEEQVFIKFDDQPFVLKSFEKPGEVALYYGFVPTQSPDLSKKDWKNSKTISKVNIANLKNRPGKSGRKEYEVGLRLEETCALFRKYAKELSSLPHPLGIYHKLPLKGDTRTKIRGQQHRLDIIDSRLPIADAVIIKTALEILNEEGQTNTHVLINSVGDDQSKTKYRRELIEYFNSNISKLPKKARILIKENVFTLMRYDDEAVKELKAGAPNPLDYLDENSRQRFMDVLEFLETLNIPYQIRPTLVGDSYFEHSIFEIRRTSSNADDKGELLARGGCYADVSKTCGVEKELPSVGITLTYNRTTKAKKIKFKLTRINKPVCYFMQLGPMAKLKSLHLIERLRKAEIPLKHTLCKEKCFGQMSLANQVKLPYIIIMGQKEALEDCVVVRNTSTYSQETISIKNLPKYVKRIAKKHS